MGTKWIRRILALAKVLHWKHAGIGSILDAKLQTSTVNPLRWVDTHCASLLNIVESEKYHKGGSFITMGGEHVSVNVHVIFHYPPHAKVTIYIL